MKKQRGKFLTFMLVLAALGIIQTPYYLINTNALQLAYGNVPSWYPIYAVLGLGLGIGMIIGMWQLKKWAVYLLVASTTLTFLSQLFILKPAQQFAGVTYAMTIVSAGLWFWAISRKWASFD
ncbi:MAG: hypothetical protein NT141_01895 [candidate division WWE3 bacterium]|nr:hypothetical protein [candidate division WWE3 bacterium]